MQRQVWKRFLARIILGTLCCVFIASCAGAPLETTMSRYNEAKVSCNSYQEFGYEKLEMPDKKIFWIDENSKVYAFDSGKSYFKAFELPNYPPPYSIYIRSYQIGGLAAGTSNVAYVFRPAIMFLDEQFAVTRFLDTGYFHYTSISFLDTASWETGWARALEGEIHIYKNAKDRYMIILTTDNLLKEHESFMTPSFASVILPGFIGAIPTGNVRFEDIPHSPVGKLKVVVRPMDGN